MAMEGEQVVSPPWFAYGKTVGGVVPYGPYPYGLVVDGGVVLGDFGLNGVFPASLNQ